MNTGKQINAMVVVLFLTLVAVGIYAIWDPFRAESKEDIQLELTEERAANLFTQNCRLCHGDAGQGGAGGSGRLEAAAQLDREDLRGITEGAFDQAYFNKQFKLVTDTISCGRVGTQMPAWSAIHGGTLNEEQIRQLTVLITGGDPDLGIYHEEGFWDTVQEHANEIDAETTRHATLEMPDGSLNTTDTEIVVSNAGPFSLGQYIRIRSEGEEAAQPEERMRILPNALRVTRGAGGTEAAAHAVGAPVLDSNGAPILDESGETEQALIEAMDDESTLVVVGDPGAFESGEVIQIDAERLEVTELVRGLPTTGQRVAKAIGREPDTILISGSDGITAEMTVRIDSEMVRIIEVSDAGETGIELDTDVDAASDVILVTDPAFFAADYVIRVGDELMNVIGAVETGQELAETIGRANTTFAISGDAGIEPEAILRMDSELMRVIAVLEPASIVVTRGEEGTAAHDAGTELFEVVEPAEDAAEDAEPTLVETDVVLAEDASADGTSFVLSGIGRLSAGGTYQLDDEVFTIEEVVPAQVRVERGLDGTEVVPHGRRVVIYAGNEIEVERGFDGTTATAHPAEDGIFMTEIRVDRAQDGSPLEDHAKNAELYLGNSLIVERGVLDTEPADHENGQLVLDFPAAPDGPPILESSCGQSASAGGATERPEPLADSAAIDIDLSEWVVDPNPTSGPAGLFSLIAHNDGAAVHNLRVILTDLPADQLPVVGSEVDEAQLDVVAQSADLAVGTYALVPSQLDAGRYVLICNFPTHYANGMFVEFEVTSP